ncbi:MAG TPA: carbohydrate porin [Terracidiphilus sp.]|nr:carbohydrate porin [Terracidiphilus sp.]
MAQLPTITESQRPAPQAQPPTQTAPTMLPHPGQGRIWLSGQANVIFQTNPPFAAQYSGPHSFPSRYDKATGSVLTVYSGLQLTHSTEILADGEDADGLGIGGAFGIAGFTDLDAVRDPTLTAAPYLARLMVHQVFAFSHTQTESDRGPLSTFSELPSRRLEIRVGKFGITDFFDTNSVGSDSHLQFMNWAIDQNGAYDFTADARGYTWGIYGEYQCPAWGLRSALSLESGPQNGGPLVWNLHRANTIDTEFELHRFLLKKPGIVRLLGWVNHANMGVYQYAIDQFLAGKTPVPDISAHPLQVTTKYGFGVNVEQGLSASVTAYGRFGWNDGKTESWSFTEIDQTFSAGVGILGSLWKRSNDHAGIAFASNGISSVHAHYLELGGLGFVLGDAGLTYGRENLMETYYTAHVWRGLYLAPDLQFIVNPGYNRARGPVLVTSFRTHIEF